MIFQQRPQPDHPPVRQPPPQQFSLEQVEAQMMKQRNVQPSFGRVDPLAQQQSAPMSLEQVEAQLRGKPSFPTNLPQQQQLRPMAGINSGPPMTGSTPQGFPFRQAPGFNDPFRQPMVPPPRPAFVTVDGINFNVIEMGQEEKDRVFFKVNMCTGLTISFNNFNQCLCILIPCRERFMELAVIRRQITFEDLMR